LKLLLDTCTFLWAIEGGGELSPTAREVLVDPAHDVFLSAVSVWEITIKHGLGRLPLPEPPERYIPAQRTTRGITALPLDEDAVLQLPRLPALHRDPFDRLLVAQAIVHGMTILTPDPIISQYPARTMW